jgi:peptidoglycan/xylan/chitin deacetylase (PgdA/CDA1 family)
LRDRGYRTLLLRQYYDLVMAGDSSAGDKKVVITFDDNNLCHFSTSTPILIDFDFQATFFVVSGFVNKQSDMLTTEQLLEMQRAGMSIESHSHTHRFLSDLNDTEMHEELGNSRRILEDYVQKEVRFISCPGGRYSKKVLNSARVAGYYGVCTSAPGLNELADWKPARRLDRFLVSATTPLETFAKIVMGDVGYIGGQVFRDRAKSALKGLLGNRWYDKLWQRYRKDL